MSILVVDDNTMLLSKIVRSLIRANRKVRSATSLTEARELLNKETPEVLCLDLQLPDGSGMDLLEEIRAELRFIQEMCVRHDIPPPKTFCYPGFRHSAEAVDVLKEEGFSEYVLRILA